MGRIAAIAALSVAALIGGAFPADSRGEASLPVDMPEADQTQSGVAPCDREGGGAAWVCATLQCCRSTRAHLTCQSGPDVDCRRATGGSGPTCAAECSLPRIP